jgi:hypothetical protein
MKHNLMALFIVQLCIFKIKMFDDDGSDDDDDIFMFL